MAETYFDPRTKKVVVGEAAAASSAQDMGDYDFNDPPAGDNPGGLVDLPELLTREKFPYQPGEIGPDNQTSSWSKDDLTSIASWVLGLLRSAGDFHLETKHLDRIHDLGIGPNADVYNKWVGPMWQLRKAIGDAEGRHYNKYAEWRPWRWARYAAQVEQRVGRKPSWEDYREAATVYNGPSLRNITDAGGANYINSLNNFFDPSTATKESLLEWGSRVQLANPERTDITTPMIGALSKKGAGPSRRLINNFFDGITDFQMQLQQYMQRKAEHRQALLNRYDNIVASTGQPEKLPANPTDTEKAGIAARYDFAGRYLSPDTQENTMRYLSTLPSNTFFTTLANLVPNETAGSLEMKAADAGLLDDIWEAEPNLNRLDITDEEIAAARQRTDTKGASGSAPSAGTEATIKDLRTQLETAVSKIDAGRMALGQTMQPLQEAQDALLRATEGSGQGDVADALSYLQEAVDQLRRAIDQAGAAIGNVRDIGGRL